MYEVLTGADPPRRSILEPTIVRIPEEGPEGVSEELWTLMHRCVSSLSLSLSLSSLLTE